MVCRFLIGPKQEERMRYLKQFSIILFFSLSGEVLRQVLPFLIPASVYGMILLLIGLENHWIEEEQVQDAAEFLLQVMPITFIPAAAGLLEARDQLEQMEAVMLILIFVTTVIVMAAAGIVSQRAERGRRK